MYTHYLVHYITYYITYYITLHYIIKQCIALHARSVICLEVIVSQRQFQFFDVKSTWIKKCELISAVALQWGGIRLLFQRLSHDHLENPPDMKLPADVELLGSGRVSWAPRG